MLTAIDQHQPLVNKADALYERYGKPLEGTHKGHYVAIAEDGRTRISLQIPSPTMSPQAPKPAKRCHRSL